MKKVNSLLLLFAIVALSLSTVAFAQQQVVKFAEPSKIEHRALNYTKPGGIVLGGAMPRAFHYGGRHSARTSDGIIHVSWEEPDYNFPYYAHSLDALGLEWTEPINIPETIGYEGWDRCLMAKLSIDPTNDDIYLLPAPQVAGGVWRTQLARSTDGGATWSPFMDLGNKINEPTAEVSWATMAIGTDRVLHITYAKQNQDMFYTKADLSAADGQADLSSLVFTKSNGTPGAEAISFVPSGVVFQGTIVLDRNNDPHIIFSGDGGSDTFGDKTPYHIYYKSAAQAWGPIPPTRLQAELERCWGMPEMVFDKENRGYYFMDDRINGVNFGTWEPPVDAESATDFGSLNNGLGFEGALVMSTDNYPDIVVTEDDLTYLPNADVDDENDVVYLVASTGSYENTTGAGGDIVALKLENATSYAGVAPADMDWKLHRWITKDGGTPLGDTGPDVIYDPASTTLDIFWSGAGASTNEANYLDGTAVIPAVDAKPQSVNFGLTTDNPINKGEEIVITGTVKNNGTSPLPPVPVKLVIMDDGDNELYSKDVTIPPLLADQVSSVLNFGSWVVPEDSVNYRVILSTSVTGDEATYNDVVGAGFFAYPSLDEATYVEIFQDYINLVDGDHVGYPFPTETPGGKGPYSEGVDLGGWAVVDSADAPEYDYYNGWLVNDNDTPLDIGASLRHMNGIRNDTTFGDITDVPQPQNELLYSPVIDLPTLAENYHRYVEFTEAIGGTDGEANYPIYAFIDVSVDGGATWETVVHHAKEGAGPADDCGVTTGYYSYDITDVAGAASSVQVRFWWRNPNNDGSFATWWVDNVYVIDRPLTNAVEQGSPAVADRYELSQNYPNPFNPSTEISFTVPVSGKATLTIFNVMGQQVAKLVDGTISKGTHKVRWDASHLSSGVYFYKLQAEGFESVKKMALMK